MNEVGNKIKEIRKAKGFSQDALASAAKVSLRTVQRIENNETQPYGKTLQLICEALGVQPESVLEYKKTEDTAFLMWFHLSALSFLVIPLGNIILPLILWLTQKNQIIQLKQIGANLLNFQILWTIVSFVGMVWYFLIKMEHHDVFFNPGFIVLGLYLLNIILPITFAILAKKGNTKPLYPNLLPIIK